jgi:hypothetical protein
MEVKQLVPKNDEVTGIFDAIKNEVKDIYVESIKKTKTRT